MLLLLATNMAAVTSRVNHHISLLLNSLGKRSAVRHDVQLCRVYLTLNKIIY